MGQNLLYGIIWFIISIVIGSALVSNGWSILGYLCYLFAGMCGVAIIKNIFPGSM